MAYIPLIVSVIVTIIIFCVTLMIVRRGYGYKHTIDSEQGQNQCVAKHTINEKPNSV